jgi:hypothetical protein
MACASSVSRGIVDQFGIGRARSGSSSIGEQVGVNGRADPTSCHAMTMPLE